MGLEDTCSVSGGDAVYELATFGICSTSSTDAAAAASGTDEAGATTRATACGCTTARAARGDR